MPLNVSIRLPDDLTERKNLIKRNLEHADSKDTKFSAEATKINSEVKKENVKTEMEVKEENKDIPDKFKTELIIPKVTIKEEVDSGSEILKDEPYKDNSVYMPMNYGMKEAHINHIHPLNLKENQLEKPKDQQPMNLNHTPYLKEPHKNEQYAPFNQNKDPLNTVIKLEPRDEPMELTNPSRTDIYNQPIVSQPLNIPTVIPMSQIGTNRPTDGVYEDEKRGDKQEGERREKLERPERLDRPERTDLGMGMPIGQPPLPSLMQSGNLVTIGEYFFRYHLKRGFLNKG